MVLLLGGMLYVLDLIVFFVSDAGAGPFFLEVVNQGGKDMLAQCLALFIVATTAFGKAFSTLVLAHNDPLSCSVVDCSPGLSVLM